MTIRLGGVTATIWSKASGAGGMTGRAKKVSKPLQAVVRDSNECVHAEQLLESTHVEVALNL